MVQHLLTIADLDDAQIDRILAGPTDDKTLSDKVIALLFLTSSLRTKLGFGAAAVRLGATPLLLDERRADSTMSAGESLRDTLRGAAGMADLLVVRADEPLHIDSARRLPIPVINGGDPGGEHPTQALIDVAAIERFAGPLREVRLGVCGDLMMRASRSLIDLLARRPPASLTFIAPSSRRAHGVELPFEVEHRDRADFDGLDVVLMTGLAPAGDATLDSDGRARFALTPSTIGTLADEAIVLSPMPVIDEIDELVRYSDPRIRIFEHSDLGVAVRMAVLQELVGSSTSPRH